MIKELWFADLFIIIYVNFINVHLSNVISDHVSNILIYQVDCKAVCCPVLLSRHSDWKSRYNLLELLIVFNSMMFRFCYLIITPLKTLSILSVTSGSYLCLVLPATLTGNILYLTTSQCSYLTLMQIVPRYLCPSLCQPQLTPAHHPLLHLLQSPSIKTGPLFSHPR